MLALPESTRTGTAALGWQPTIFCLFSPRPGADDCRIEAPAGLRVERFTDPAEMLIAVGANPPAMVVIDSHVRGFDAAGVVRVLTTVAGMPVYIGVWEDEDSKAVAYRSLDGGAKGLLAMPVDGQALQEALLAHGGGRTQGLTRLRLGALEMFEESRETRLRGQRIHLAESEFGLLRCLVRAYPRPVSTVELKGGCNECGEYRSAGVGSTVARLRRHLEEVVPGASEIIGTIRGLGYVAREFV
jgi:DNA-binding response OmpR family regulator